MSSDHYEKVVLTFTEAADLDGENRRAYLDRACTGNERLRRDVELMLSQDRVEDDLFHEKRLSKGFELLNSAIDAAPSPPPESIGPYRIIKKIGEGGMGTVYQAEQDKPRRLVALKMIRAGLISAKTLKRFRNEAEVLGRLRHPGIAQIHEAGEADTPAGKLPYFAMEYIEGTGLKRYVVENSLSTEARCELVARVCDAVNHAHEKGIVHRDLKPENIFVVKGPVTSAASGASEAGQPKVLDFGVARATDADVQLTTVQAGGDRLVGTLTYMSPEQASADLERLDRRSDIYSLGVILYELMAGRPPFDLRHKPIPEAARIVCEDEPTRLASTCPEFRGDLDTITCKAIEKEPERRYASAAEMAADLRRYLAHEPIAAHPPTVLYQLGKFVRRRKGLTIGLALAALILVAGTITSLTFGVQALKGKKQAMEKEAEARRDAYRLNIATADAWGESDPVTALKCLDSVPLEFRGWEWHHLNARINHHVSECRIEDCTDPGSGTPSSDGNSSDRSSRGLFCSDGEIRLVDTDSRESRRIFRAAGGLSTPALSPRGTMLAAVCKARGKIIVWNAEDGTRVRDFTAESSLAIHLCFSPDDALVAWCSPPEGLTVAETATGRVLFKSDPSFSNARLAAFSTDGSRLAVICGYTGDPLRLGCDRIVRASVFSRDGEILAEKTISEGACDLAFSPDNGTIAVGHFQRTIGLYDSVTLECSEFLLGHTKPISAIAYSPDGAFLASASRDGTTRIWNLSGTETEQILVNPQTGMPITDLHFSGDGSLLAAGNRSVVRRWAFKTDARRVLEGHGSFVYKVTFSPDGALIAAGDFENRITLWHAFTGERLAAFRGVGASAYLKFSADGNRLIDTAVWDPAAATRLTAPRDHADEALFAAIRNPDSVLSALRLTANLGTRHIHTTKLVFSHDRSLAVEGTTEGEIRIREPATGRSDRLLGRHESRAYALAFSPDDQRVITGDGGGTIKVWDVLRCTEMTSFSGHDGEVYALVFSPDGNRIASGGNDGTVILWDGDTYEQIAVLRGHISYVHSLAFSPDGTMLASGSGDKTVRIWDSIPRTDRLRQVRKIKALESDARTLVNRLSGELDDPLDVADRIRSDDSLDPALRSAALSALLRRSQERDSGTR